MPAGVRKKRGGDHGNLRVLLTTNYHMEGNAMQNRLKRTLAALAALALPLAGAGVTIHGVQTTLEPAQTWVLTASHENGRAQAWTWRVEGICGGSLRLREDGPGVVYQAPPVLGPQKVAIRATAPDGSTATFVTALAPGAGPIEKKSPDKGPSLESKLPGMRHFAPNASHPCEEFEDGRLPSPHMRMVPLKEGKAETPADRWLLASTFGMWTVSSEGVMTRLALRGHFSPDDPVPPPGAEGILNAPYHIHGVAVHPLGLGAPDAPRIVFTVSLSAGTRVGAQFLCELRPDGEVLPLADLESHAGFEGCSWGGDSNRFGPITMDASGTIYLTTNTGLLMTFFRNQQVSLLAGARQSRGRVRRDMAVGLDGQGRAAQFGAIKDLTLDHATGDLYLLDSNTVRRVTRLGEVETVLGRLDLPADATRINGFEPVPEGIPVPPASPCLNGPQSLHFSAGHLFIADTVNDAVRMFNPRTRTLHTLAGGPGDDMPALRFGPLAAFTRFLPGKDWASLATPLCVTVQGSTCLVCTHDRLVVLDLPPEFGAGVGEVKEPDPSRPVSEASEGPDAIYDAS